ncbi:predicted protein [Lichtheimia corymbifera JMRC:FSU:9682]|uniref:Calcipressin-domain-containing protein n=1 Tax=Lichtheimia corymbifera JMRC:FSU:9682 TaxID=1263082 RepID=A0A068RGT5_9FUNG|nr:predicted protein [Lichtheimia corymbifera JMRC:FSU:9682]
MPNVPAIFFQNPTVISTIRQHFESFGDLYTFVVIKGFRRLMIVYNETSSAVKARDFLDRRMLSWTTVDHSIVEDLSLDYISSSMGCQAQQQPPSSPLPGRRYEDMIVRLYFGQHNPINPDPRLFQLQVPQSEKNFLISPPGSPFADWKQKTESPPNTAVLASDLTFTTQDVVDDDLENFRLESPMSSDDEMEDVNATTTPTTPGKRSSLMVIGCSGDADNQVPMITVQDWDGDAVTTSTGSMLQGTTTSRPPTTSAFPKAKVVPTARPPVKI